MSSVEYINEPVLVEAQLAPDGSARPVALFWRGQLLRITDHGRTWQEEVAGTTWRCYLVRARGGAYELRLNPAAAQWILARRWPSDALA